MKTILKRNKLAAALLMALSLLALAFGAMLWRAPAAAQAAAEHDHADGTWTAIATDGGTLSGGNYYLAEDVVLTKNLTFSGTVTLCLNGHVLTGTGTGSVILINSDSNFTLCDCSTDASNVVNGVTYTSGVITGGDNGSGGGIYVNVSTFTMEGGTIAGNKAGQQGGGLRASSSTLTLKGGAICDNYSSQYGGGISLNADNMLTIEEGFSITNNFAEYSGGGIDCSASDIILNGGTISQNEASDGGGIYVSGSTNLGAKLTMKGGEISHNDAAYGGGISSWYANVELSGGSVSENESDYDGGGIYFAGDYYYDSDTGLTDFYSNDYTLKITGDALISGNISYDNWGGGGVYMYYAKMDMDGGAIRGNISYSDYSNCGGGVYAGVSEISISGGAISDNEASKWGGGVYFVGEFYYDEEEEDYVYTDNDFTLTVKDNALISGNIASGNRGGGVYVEHAKIVMNGGTISGNEVDGSGGGVWVKDNSRDNGEEPTVTTVTLTGGTIAGNIAEGDGGGVYLTSAIMKMSGGTIEENRSGPSNGGGGMYVNKSATLDLSGGEIINNFTYGDNGGGGIYAQSAESTIKLSGAPVVTGNMFNDREDNLCYRADDDPALKIEIVGPFTQGAKIGINLYNHDIEEEDWIEGNSWIGSFMSDYSKYNDADPSKYFFSDDPAFVLDFDESGNVAVKQGTYTVVYVGPDGTKTEESGLVIYETLTLQEVTAQEGYIGGWTLAEGGNSIDYTSGQVFEKGLGKVNGEVITLYAIEVRDIASEVEGIASELKDAVAAVEVALESGSLTDLQDALDALIQSYTAADAVIRTDFGAADEALKAELESSMEEAIGTVEASVEALRGELEQAVEDLQAAIAAGGGASSDALESAIAEMKEAYTAADTALKSEIGAAFAEADAQLKSAIDELEKTLTNAYTQAVGAVEETLKAEIERVEGLIESASSENMQELTERVAALTDAYTAADALIREEFAAADEALKASLESAMKEADGSLQSAIDKVAQDLETAKNELNAAIEANEKDIEEKLAALDEAYKAADELLRGEVTALGEELAGSLEALESAYKAADDAMLAAIEELRADLSETESALSAQIEQNEIVLWVTFAIGILALGAAAAGIVLALRSRKRG